MGRTRSNSGSRKEMHSDSGNDASPSSSQMELRQTRSQAAGVRSPTVSKSPVKKGRQSAQATDDKTPVSSPKDRAKPPPKKIARRSAGASAGVQKAKPEPAPSPSIGPPRKKIARKSIPSPETVGGRRKRDDSPLASGSSPSKGNEEPGPSRPPEQQRSAIKSTKKIPAIAERMRTEREETPGEVVEEISGPSWETIRGWTTPPAQIPRMPVMLSDTSEGEQLRSSPRKKGGKGVSWVEEVETKELEKEKKKKEAETKTSPRKKKAVESDEEDESSGEEEVMKTRGRRGPAKKDEKPKGKKELETDKKTASQAKKRPTKKKMIESDESSDEEEEEVVMKTRGRRAVAKKDEEPKGTLDKDKKKKKKAADSDEEEEELESSASSSEEEEVVKKTRGRKAPATKPKSRKELAKEKKKKSAEKKKQKGKKKKGESDSSSDEEAVKKKKGKRGKDKGDSEESDSEDSVQVKNTKTKGKKTTKKKTKKKGRRAGVGDNVESDVEDSDDDNMLAKNTEVPLDVKNILNYKMPPKPRPIMAKDGTGRRLSLYLLQIFNFKSYYGAHEFGPFHHNLNAIMGPNGSGKSNIIDALLFVFGFKAKKIRSDKLSVLIHNSKEYPEQLMAMVKVMFVDIEDMPDGTVKVYDETGFTISRQVFRSNCSEYKLNGKTCRFADVERKLNSVGIDLKYNRFLILQGEVEQIALMKPTSHTKGETGMLEYLEDIIGSRRFKDPITKCEERVEELSVLTSHQNMLTQRAIEEKNKAELPALKTISFYHLENAILSWRIKLKLREKIEARRVLAEYAPKMRDMTNELGKIIEGEESLTENINMTVDLERDTERMRDQFRDKVLTYEEKHSDLVHRLPHAEEMLAREKADHEARLLKAQEAMGEFLLYDGRDQLRAQGMITEPDKDLIHRDAALTKQMTVAQEDYDAAKKKRTEYSPKFMAVTKEDREQLKRIEQMIGEHEPDLILIDSKIEILKSMISSCGEEDYYSKQNRLTQIDREIEALQEFVDTNNKTVEDQRRSIDAYKEQETSIVREMEKYRDQQAQIEKQLNDLAFKRDQAESTYCSGVENQITKALEKAKAHGKIKGFYGRLGDLCCIDPKYDRAVSNALKHNCHTYLVDNCETAQICSNYLKENSLGSATFCMIDKQIDKFQRRDRRFVAPPNSLRLYDLIEVDDEVIMPGVYLFTSHLLVADDIDIATDVYNSMKNNRRYSSSYTVTTLDGIEVSRNYQGGGKPLEGFMRLKGQMSSRDAEKKNAEKKKIIEDIERISAQSVEIGICIRNGEAKAFDLNQKHKMLEYELRSITATLEQKKRNLGNQRAARESMMAMMKKIKYDAEAIAKHRKDIETLQGVRIEKAPHVEKLRELQAHFTDKIRTLKYQMVEQFETLMRKSKDKVERLKDMIENPEVYLKNKREFAAALDKKLRRDLDRCAIDQKDIHAMFLELDNFKNDIALLEFGGKHYEEKFASATEVLGEVRSKKIKYCKEQEDNEKRKLELKAEISQQKKRQHESETTLTVTDEQIREMKPRRIAEVTSGLPAKAIAMPETLSYYDLDGARPKTRMRYAKIRGLYTDYHMSEVEEMMLQERDELALEKIPTYSDTYIARLDVEKVKQRISALKREREERKLENNEINVDEYRRRFLKAKEETASLEVFLGVYRKHSDLLDKWKAMRVDEFMEGFEQIADYVESIYKRLTGNQGSAVLELRDSSDPFQEGVQFKVRPPKKTWKNIQNLSGGEKTLSSLALVFALHRFRPTPIYIMDEIDAALDHNNVTIIGHYIKHGFNLPNARVRENNAQHIIISLRNNMFEYAPMLFGVYKLDNISLHVEVDVEGVKKQVAPKIACMNRFGKYLKKNTKLQEGLYGKVVWKKNEKGELVKSRSIELEDERKEGEAEKDVAEVQGVPAEGKSTLIKPANPLAHRLVTIFDKTTGKHDKVAPMGPVQPEVKGLQKATVKRVIDTKIDDTKANPPPKKSRPSKPDEAETKSKDDTVVLMEKETVPSSKQAKAAETKTHPPAKKSRLSKAEDTEKSKEDQAETPSSSKQTKAHPPVKKPSKPDAASEKKKEGTEVIAVEATVPKQIKAAETKAHPPSKKSRPGKADDTEKSKEDQAVIVLEDTATPPKKKKPAEPKAIPPTKKGRPSRADEEAVVIMEEETVPSPKKAPPSPSKKGAAKAPVKRSPAKKESAS